MQQAADKADSLIGDTLSSVRPPLEWTHDQSDSGMCTGAPELGDVTRRAVVMTQVSEERKGSLLGIIERAWKKSGYTITKVYPDEEFPTIIADAGDGVLRMDLTVGYKGQFFLKVQTACVDKSKVAQPSTPGKGTDYRGKEVPTPNVHSDFWSSDEPVSSSSPS
ncbi:hypothetical protein OG887_26445 [Streptomyces sp. NBC_00053]|uniref:hypothetical protein n=1 Tax=unclassified Streptomyces TaxID=2593676 RepID=UPI001F1523F8|nr:MULTISPECIES: hypothetical protein [unclassified Streptomyces]WSG55942.1 hypothetical protein OHA38_26685 [Streptomyces sp. NBC_01732]WSX07077.1 hypothetical protein OG355_26740 [Streptomyces sp. NBC_00987]MCX5106204.1 hypothetical protein [Streptomyces sp. NBC_00439]MCX5162658.1 hypothetical protein [Streptomyces sp. NBC_00305]MCX5221175.1 hypothetical protein [Streptomyces sp. NBC_00264]